MRPKFDRQKFDQVFRERVLGGEWQEESSYYPRYRTRYRMVLERYAALRGGPEQAVLDVGGGQLGVIAQGMWGDTPAVADVDSTHLARLESKGIEVIHWNLIDDVQPVENKFDTIFFSEVIEHLPIPGHLILTKLRNALKPGGLLICTTPNLYRLRNIIYLIVGKNMFCHFEYPTDKGLGHILEYSKPHLEWQLDKAGYEKISIEYSEIPHLPNILAFRLMHLVGYPLFLVPRFRGNLIATAYAPA